MARQILLGSSLRGPHLLGTEAEALSPYEGSLNVPLEHPGTCPRERVVHFNLFDNSGSMGWGNDPIGNRFDEVRYALHHLARHCRCGRELSAVMHFDSPTSCDVLPIKLDRQGLAALEAGLVVPPDGAGISMLGPSLARVNAIVAKQPDFSPVLTVLSDFELFDPTPTLHDLAHFPGTVHAVVFRSKPPQLLVDAPDVLVTRVQPSEPPGAVAKAIVASMTTHRKPQPRRPFAKKEPLRW